MHSSGQALVSLTDIVSVPVLIHRVNPNVPGTHVRAATGPVRPSTGAENPLATTDAQRNWIKKK